MITKFDKYVEQLNETQLNEGVITSTLLLTYLLYKYFVADKLRIKDAPQYTLEIGGDLFIGFVKFLNSFNYSVDTDVLKHNWDGILKKALGKYYKEGGVLYPLLDKEGIKR